MVKCIARFDKKQMGDACEMLVAAELTLTGNPAAKMPDNWPQYDLVSQTKSGKLEKISVKGRSFKKGSNNFANFYLADDFDWLAIVLLYTDEPKRRDYYLIPKSVAIQKSRKYTGNEKINHNMS